MKKATPNSAGRSIVTRFKSRKSVITAILCSIAITFAAVNSTTISARQTNTYEQSLSDSKFAEAISQNVFLSGILYARSSLLTSSLIVQIGFNSVNEPASFTAGVSNPASRPLRIQTQRADGAGENVTGSGQAVFILLTTSSPTGRFDLSPTGGFTTSSMTVTVTAGRQNSQDIFYRDPTPGTVVLTGAVTSTANTGLTFGETASVTKSVVAVGVGRLRFGTQPTNTIKDAQIVPPVTVRVEDAAGNLDTSSNRNVSLALASNPSSAVLGGTTTVAAVNGIATFNNLNINRPGLGYTLVATSPLPGPELTTVTSNAFNVLRLGQSIEFDEPEDKTYGDDDFKVHAKSSSGAQVSFSSLTTDTCSVKADSVKILAAGVCTIRGSQNGDEDHDPAEAVDRSFTIHKADAVVVVMPYDVVYDGLPHSAAIVSITGVNGETEAEVGAVDISETVHTNAGTYANDVWTFTGNPNYNDTLGTVNNLISKAPVTATAGSGTSTYDGTPKSPSNCTISGSGYLGDLTCSNVPSEVGPNADSYAIGSSVSGTGLSNFDIAKIDGTFSIEKAQTVVSISFEPGPYVYRGSGFNATARVTGAGGLDEAISPVTYSGDCVNVTGPNGCRATDVFPGSANYESSVGSASITLSKKDLAVSASNHSVLFGDPAPEISPSIEGFIGSENSSFIDVLPSCSTTYEAGVPVGLYQSFCFGGDDNNYNFVSPYASGTVSVTTACSAFNGFLSPIGGANAYPQNSGPGGSYDSPLRSVKLNSTIPFKFTATCFGDALRTGIQALSARRFENGSPVNEDILAQSENRTFQYSGGQWHLNFKTADLGRGGHGIWLFEVRLFDGSRYNVWIEVRK